MNDDKNQALLAEYAGCAEQVSRLDSLIWQTAGVVFPIALGGFAFFGIAEKHSREQFLAMVAVAVGSSTLVVLWYFLSRTWYLYQSAGYYRMREIESSLGLLHYRYSRFLRLPRNRRITDLKQMSDGDREAFRRLDEAFPSRPSVGARQATTALTILFVLAWVSLVVREYTLLPAR